MTPKVVHLKSTVDPKGRLITVEHSGTESRILFTYHSMERCARWGLKLDDVAECLVDPDEVLLGHCGRYIAHKVSGNHLIRAVYEYENDLPILITVYYPYKERYYQGGGTYEDKIF